MNIRNILKSDIQYLAQLMISIYNNPPWNDDWTEKTAFDSLNTLLEFPQFYGNVIFTKEKIIGAILGHIRTYSKEKTYYIDEFFISNEYQRQGVATNLYQTTINELKTKGIAGAFFTTLKNSPAYHFYTKQGAWDLTDSACFYHKF